MTRERYHAVQNCALTAENPRARVLVHPSKNEAGRLCAVNTKSTLDPQPSKERMKIMSNLSSAPLREETPRNSDALKRRAQSIINDKSIDAQTRTIIRYGLGDQRSVASATRALRRRRRKHHR
jgi:hypothetical protein